MRIPRIGRPQVRNAARAVKHVYVEKEKTVKHSIPGMLLFAQAVTGTLQAPGAFKIVKTLSSSATHTLEKADELPSAEFLNIKGMVQKIVPDVSDEFVTQILKTSEHVKCDPEDLTALLFKESRFDPKAKSGSFHGLGQMNTKSLSLSIQHAQKDSAARHGVTPLSMADFVELPREKQMPYVRNYILAMRTAYLKPEQKLDGGTLYGLFYTPGRVNQSFLTSAKDSATAKLYACAPHFDFDKDSVITKQDMQNYLNQIKRLDLKVHTAQK